MLIIYTASPSLSSYSIELIICLAVSLAFLTIALHVLEINLSFEIPTLQSDFNLFDIDLNCVFKMKLYF